jgi:hypothetical protein
VLVACSSAATVASLANAGVCYVYVRNATAPYTYALAATLQSPTPRAGGFFGGQDGSVSVSATGLVVAIGEPAVAPSGTAYGSGTVYVFTAADASWASSTSVQLAPTTPLAGNFYGWMASCFLRRALHTTTLTRPTTKRPQPPNPYTPHNQTTPTT